MNVVKGMIALALAVFVLPAGLARSQNYVTPADRDAWFQAQDARRQASGALCELWFAAWRPGAVGGVYLALSARYSAIHSSSACGPVLRRYLLESETTATAVGELFGQGGNFPDVTDVIRAITSVDDLKRPLYPSARGRRILDLLREQRDSERRVIEYLQGN